MEQDMKTAISEGLEKPGMGNETKNRGGWQ